MFNNHKQGILHDNGTVVTNFTTNTNLPIFFVSGHLWKELSNDQLNQENVAKSLARIRYTLGEDRFKVLLGSERHKDLQKICDNYGLPIEYSDRESDNEKLYWDEEETIEDRVILETEIKLRTGPAITMKIHEESRSNSTSDGVGDSEEE